MPSSQTFSTLALVALMIVAFYFLIIRPQRKRAAAQQTTMNQLGPGTRVMLGSGLFGTVVSVGEKQIVLEISPGNQLTVLKQAIGKVVQPTDEDDYSGTDDDDDEDYEPSTLDLVEPPVEPVRTVEPFTPGTSTESTSVTSQSTPEPVGEPESRGGTANSKE